MNSINTGGGPARPSGPGNPAGQEPLARALQRAAQVLDAQRPPPALRDAVLQRVQRAGHAGATPASLPTRPPRPAPRRWLRLTAWSGGAAMLAMLLMASAVLWLVPPPQPVARIADSEFLPLVPREDWPDEATPAWLVKSELPQERLAALGLPYDPTRAAERVRTELLVHPSGVVLALRLID